MTPPLLDSIALVRTIPCPADPGRIIVVGRPSRGLAEALPYLASLPNAIAYNPDAVALTLRRNPGFITFYDQTIYITKVDGLDEGLTLLEALTQAVNATWQHRSELIPVTSRRRAPAPLDVWALLPQTNCGQCGIPTCMAFAFGLLQQTRRIADCPALREDPAFSESRATLEAML
jgi:ArsR family metal-binding transcriptional regulator